METTKPVLNALSTENLMTKALDIKARTIALEVKSDMDQQKAVSYVQIIQVAKREVTDEFKDPKSEAQKTHKDIVAKEKAILTPLEAAETDIRKKIADYQRIAEQRKRGLEEAARRAREEETLKLLDQAAEKESSGDVVGAAFVLAEAQTMELFNPVVQTASKAVQGFSTSNIWKARVIDESKVPISVAGIVIRPVDESVLNKLARDSKGKVIIEGVEFYEDQSIRIRGGK